MRNIKTNRYIKYYELLKRTQKKMGRQQKRNHALYKQFGMERIVQTTFKYNSIFYGLDSVIYMISQRTGYERFEMCAIMTLSDFYECCERLERTEKEFNEMDNSETEINSITNFIQHIKLLNYVDVEELEKLAEEEKIKAEAEAKMKELQKLAEEEAKIKAEEEAKKKPKRKRKRLYTSKKRNKKIKIE